VNAHVHASASDRHDLLLSANGDDEGLIAEAGREKTVLRVVAPGVLTALDPINYLSRWALARQFLPGATNVSAGSVGMWAREIITALDQPMAVTAKWRLVVAPLYHVRKASVIGARAQHSERLEGQGRSPGWSASTRTVSSQPTAGENRCRLIREVLLEQLGKHRRWLLRSASNCEGAFEEDERFVQLLLTSPECGWLSICPPPELQRLRHWISPFTKGEVPVPNDRNAPSRAFAKLVETELRLGRRIQPGEVCVDLGASPGGWTWVARQRGARVIAVDRSPLRDDLMNDSAVTFVRGDAFGYEPARPVDWLVCDVIAAPERSVELVLEWARRRWMRHFVVTIKLRVGDHPKLDRLKAELPAWSDDWYLTHLSANKHEACVFGTVRDSDPVSP